MGNKKLVPGNSVMKVISSQNKPIFIEIILLFIRQNTIASLSMPLRLNAVVHMEFCLVINVEMGGN